MALGVHTSQHQSKHSHVSSSSFSTVSIALMQSSPRIQAHLSVIQLAAGISAELFQTLTSNQIPYRSESCKQKSVIISQSIRAFLVTPKHRRHICTQRMIGSAGQPLVTAGAAHYNPPTPDLGRAGGRRTADAEGLVSRPARVRSAPSRPRPAAPPG